jgi:hypothetical protein
MMINFKELQKWAKSRGYDVVRDTDGVNWKLVSDESHSGKEENSTKAATAIYNDITDGAYREYQREYAKEKASKDVVFKPPT